MYLAFDPGATTGWAKFDNAGNIVDSGQVSHDELMDVLFIMEGEHAKDPIKAIIYEDYRLFGHKAKAQIGSDMPASQAIGMIKTLIKKTGAFEVRQAASIKPIAEKWTQVVPPSNHANSHWVDAFNHGAFFLIKTGVRKSELERNEGAV